MNTVIGGEFEFLEPQISVSSNNIKDGYIMYSSGRAAFYQILNYLKDDNRVDSIYLPDYICDSVYHVCERLGISYYFYSISENFHMDRNMLKNIYRGG